MRTFGEPPPPPTFFERLKQGLAKKGGLSDSLVGLFTRRKLDAETLAELEETLIRADLPLSPNHRQRNVPRRPS